jgi:hypothetical protein
MNFYRYIIAMLFYRYLITIIINHDE